MSDTDLGLPEAGAMPAVEGGPLSDEQQEAFDRAAALIRRAGLTVPGATDEAAAAPDEPLLAVLGRAGSGKTRVMARLAEALREGGAVQIGPDGEGRKAGTFGFAVVAPTNKAASVLRQRGVAATTVHRIVYTPVYDPEYEKIAEWLKNGGEGERPDHDSLDEELMERALKVVEETGSVTAALATVGLRGAEFITGWSRRDETIDVGLVDESSMLDRQAIADLRETFGTLILFGDPAQLAPVGDGGEMPIAALPDASKAMLEQVHRQAAGNPIVDLARALGDEAMGFEAFEALVAETAARDDRVSVERRADADLMARSPVLVWRNATRVRLIQAFRAAHGLPDEALQPGEPLICDGLEIPAKRRKDRALMESMGLVKGAQAFYLGAGRKPGFAKVFLDGMESPQVSIAAIVQIERTEAEPLLADAARHGATFVHGAACTIHKAQGSQWPEVQVFAPDLYAAHRSGRSEAGVPLWKRLAYVAVTRAQHRLRWVTRYAMARPETPLTADDLTGG